MAIGSVKQQNIAVNKARHLIFFEGTNVCFNYKTQQWTRIPAYDGFGVYSLNDKDATFGLVRESGTAIDLQGQGSAGVVQTATITSSATKPNPGGRGVVEGVRPVSNGGTHAIRVGIQDFAGDTVSWVTGTALNSRSRTSNFRGNANTPEGRYIRVEDVITGGFESAVGAYIDTFPQGEL